MQTNTQTTSMQQLSERISRLSESATIAMAQKSRELQAQGIDVISLSLGEPDFDTPEFIKEAAKEAIEKNYSHYTPVPGYQDLREAISAKFYRDNQLDYAPDQIVVSTGAKQCLANIVMSIINPGDEVIIPTPFWVTYQEIVKMAEGDLNFVEATIENDFKITPDQLDRAISEKTRLIMFSSPCNPSGSVYSKEELEALAAVIRKYPQVMVIADEIYELINFSGKTHSLAACEGIYDQVVTVNGVSKAFAMTGWRVGYMGAPKWLASACNKMQGQFTSGTCSIAQRAAKAAVEADPSVVDEMKAKFKERRDLVLERLGKIPDLGLNVPEGAFYVFPDVSNYFGRRYKDMTIDSANELAMYLLTEGRVAVVTGDAFGSPNNIRLSYAASEETLIEACNRIEEALSKLV